MCHFLQIAISSVWRVHGTCKRPLAFRTGSGDTVGMLGHVFDHQAPLTRPSEGARAVCPRRTSSGSLGEADPELEISGNSKNIGFSKCLFCMGIGLDDLWMGASHCAAPFVIELHLIVSLLMIKRMS